MLVRGSVEGSTVGNTHVLYSADNEGRENVNNTNIYNCNFLLYCPDTTYSLRFLSIDYLLTRNRESIIANQEIRLEKVGFNLLLLN